MTGSRSVISPPFMDDTGQARSVRTDRPAAPGPQQTRPAVESCDFHRSESRSPPVQNGKIPEKSLSLVLSELSEEHVGDRTVVGRIASSARSDGQVPMARSYSAPSD